MTEQESWNQFASSGRVMDYLEYRGCLQGGMNATNIVPDQTMAGSVLMFEEGDRRTEENRERNEDAGAGNQKKSGRDV